MALCNSMASMSAQLLTAHPQAARLAQPSLSAQRQPQPSSPSPLPPLATPVVAPHTATPSMLAAAAAGEAARAASVAQIAVQLAMTADVAARNAAALARAAANAELTSLPHSASSPPGAATKATVPSSASGLSQPQLASPPLASPSSVTQLLPAIGLSASVPASQALTSLASLIPRSHGGAKPSLPSPESPHTPATAPPTKFVMGSKQQASKQQASKQQARSGQPQWRQMFGMQAGPSTLAGTTSHADHALGAIGSSKDAAGAKSLAIGLSGRRGNLHRSAGRAQGTSAAVADAALGVASSATAQVAAAMLDMGAPPEDVALVAAPVAQHHDQVEAPVGEDMAEGLYIPCRPRTRAPVALKRQKVTVPPGSPKFWFAVKEDRVLRQRTRSCYAQPAVNSKHTSMLSGVLC